MADRSLTEHGSGGIKGSVAEVLKVHIRKNKADLREKLLEVTHRVKPSVPLHGEINDLAARE